MISQRHQETKTTMNNKAIKRTRYFEERQDPATHKTTIYHPGHTTKDHYNDLEEFHLPLSCAHHAYLHGWGIAAGLEVSTIAGTEFEVKPGVAIDRQGRLMVLGGESKAYLGDLVQDEGQKESPVPVQLDLQVLPDNLKGKRLCLTLEYHETLRLNEGAGGRLEQTPQLSLHLADEYRDEGPAVVLGIVEVDESGGVTVETKVPDLNYGRRFLGHTVPGNLHVGGSLNVTGATQLSEVSVNSSLSVTGNILAEGNLSIKGATQLSEVSVNGSLSVTGNILAEGNLSIKGATQLSEVGVNGSLSITGGLQTAGNLQVSGATQLAEARTTTLNVTGQTSLSGGLTVTGNVGIGTTKPAQELHIVTSGRNADVRLEQEGYQYLDLFSGKESGLWSYGNRHLLFGTDAQERMRITGDGKVGIRTKTPEQTLDINGRLHISQGVIQRGGAPITSTKDLGLYSQVPGNWMRFVTNNAPFRFFADSGIGGKAIFSIEANGVVKLEDNLCVTSGQENLRLIRGSVDPTGQIVAGAGFRVTKVGRGLYDIVFSVKYPSRPTVVATQYFAGSGNGGNTRDNCTVVSVSSTTCRLKCGNGDGEPSDRHFEFIVMGPR